MGLWRISRRVYEDIWNKCVSISSCSQRASGHKWIMKERLGSWGKLWGGPPADECRPAELWWSLTLHDIHTTLSFVYMLSPFLHLFRVIHKRVVSFIYLTEKTIPVIKLAQWINLSLSSLDHPVWIISISSLQFQRCCRFLCLCGKSVNIHFHLQLWFEVSFVWIKRLSTANAASAAADINRQESKAPL